MQSYRLRHVPRLARILIGRVLDHRAAVEHTRLRCDLQGGVLHLDRLTWRRRSVALRGRNACGPLTVKFEGGRSGFIPDGDFDITLARPGTGSGELRLTASDVPRDTGCFTAPPRWREGLVRGVRLPGVIRDILRELPGIVALMRRGDPMVSQGIQQRLGITTERAVPVLPAKLFGPIEARAPQHLPAIVLPVFNGFDNLDPLLNHLHAGCGTPHHLILVDDGSKDSRIAPRLEAYVQAHPCVHLIRHRRNLGFVQSANAGIAEARRVTRGHIVLLNSDVQPPEGWLPRLLAPILADPKIASVTPMSNAAEILSVPPHSGAGPLNLPRVQAIDQTARGLSRAAALVEVPTGIGFCLAMNRAFIDRIGGFDSMFGRGYGEEVDWCQKARRLGGRHVCAANLFVGHHGAASFGEAARAVHRQKGDALINYRYPDFEADVREWCHDDPLFAARLVLTLAWLAEVSDDAVPVFVAHSLGGGAEAALRVEVAAAFAAGSPGVVILRVGGPRHWRIEVECPEGRQVAEVQCSAQLADLMRHIPLKRLVFSCGVGATDPMDVPRVLAALADDASAFEVRLHDYLAISPSWTLLGQDGRYRGVPDIATVDSAHALPGEASHRDWREAWSRVLLKAREVTTFSASSAAILQAAYPGIKDRIRLRPHRLIQVPAPVLPGGQNIGVLGNINKAKGAEVLMRLSGHLRDRRLIVVGQMDGRFQLSAPHVVYGPYDRAEISGLAQRYDIGMWLIPSIWPETFSFVTHEALATGLPVLVFDLGAQAEAARAAPSGHVLPMPSEDMAALVGRIENLFLAQRDESVRAVS